MNEYIDKLIAEAKPLTRSEFEEFVDIGLCPMLAMQSERAVFHRTHKKKLSILQRIVAGWHIKELTFHDTVPSHLFYLTKQSFANNEPVHTTVIMHPSMVPVYMEVLSESTRRRLLK